MSRVFLDTNILVYSCDRDSPEKRSIAQTLIEEQAKSGNIVISTQVLQEFYVTAVRNLGIPPLDAKSLVHSFLMAHVVTIDPYDIVRAVDGNILWQISFWDALIITAAMKAECSIVLTEDLQHGRIVEAVEIRNPFAGTL